VLLVSASDPELEPGSKLKRNNRDKDVVALTR
jgi:hypothetical protein